MPFDGTQLDEVTLLLIRGREAIERGWCQGSYAKGDAVCMEGAVGRRNGYCLSSVIKHAIDRLRANAISSMKRSFELPTELTTWNDAPGRTKEEVLAAFDRAIANR